LDKTLIKGVFVISFKFAAPIIVCVIIVAAASAPVPASAFVSPFLA
jgi:hypothetical protein